MNAAVRAVVRSAVYNNIDCYGVYKGFEGLILDDLYPETPIPLDHYSAYTLLIAVMLSAQTTDKKVNEVTPELFKLADSPEKMVKLKEEHIKKIIKR